ncbi:MarR family winged helix-turn-helix transcriptional regulator [Couchioplanes caeruleus]|uniref:MarR family winged helix-turn-helix transcriptional regulator n=1 Tax=Couchioplanes caeruleus TaxID=56438 RepID=UPI0020BEF3BA|nr:MarR family winged helix-turn-helix transcriptional regulator [Couchioplanes caeruleus]UQU61794.1 MarR family winged helix-turn-helix transcriptional regulator [Couchioplanes caeruleus]
MLVEVRGQALFAFVRFWSRRWTGAGLSAETQRGRDVMVVEAVHALGKQGRPTSINDVARELGIDQSGVSRMVTRAQQQGFVVRRAPGRIGAAAVITNTAAGEELLRQAHAWQDRVLRRLTADWPAEDVETLLMLMDRLVRAQNTADQTGPPTLSS